MVGRSLQAGLITGAAMTLLAGAFFIWPAALAYDRLWPMAFIPVLLSGVYALQRTGSRVKTAAQAAVAGGLSGIAAGAIVSVGLTALTSLSTPSPPNPTVLWNGVAVLSERPFLLPLASILLDLGGPLPFPWPFMGATPAGGQFARVPWTLVLYLPVGVVLSATQAWLSFVAARRAGLGEHLVRQLALVPASFRVKLLVGFSTLSVMIFLVGFLGFSAIGGMHVQLHTGRAQQHNLDHALNILNNLRIQQDALNRLVVNRDASALEDVNRLRREIGAELAHLKTVPPPFHQSFVVGRTGGTVNALSVESQKRLPAVQEADRQLSDLSAATTRLLELHQSGREAEVGALWPSLAPVQRAVEAPLWAMVNEIEVDQVEWIAMLDGASHGELMANMLLVLAATGSAFSLGYVFSQVVVRPVNRVSRGLERIGTGDFATRVQVDNRDELGQLAVRVNQSAQELAGLYEQLSGLNENLQQKVQEQLAEIERARELKRYLSPQVADSIIAGSSDVKLTTTRKNLTICFADIRGFTGLSERMEPEELVDLLNDYFTAMTEIAFRRGGTLDKYLGDGMLVFFGDPVPLVDHAQRAVSMAVEMRERLVEFQKRWFLNRQETLNIGVGISTGYVTVGNIGSHARLDYTVIGNNVNLASRLADLAGPGEILITERTMVQVQELVQAVDRGEVTVKGSARPVRIFAVQKASGAPDTALPGA